jgi:hypothetical protein
MNNNAMIRYVWVRLKERWLIIPLSALILLVRIYRFGSSRLEGELFSVFVLLIVFWPMKGKWESW